MSIGNNSGKNYQSPLLRLPMIVVKNLLLFIGLLTLFSCSSPESQQKSERPPLNKPQGNVEKPVVYFGMITRYNPRIMYEEYQPIMDYLTENTPYRFELKLGKTYEDAVEYLCNGIVDIASLGVITYLEAHEKCGAIPIVRPMNKDGEPYYHSIIVVRENSPIRSLQDLKGHSFAFASEHSTSGYFIPRYYLEKSGLKLQDFSKVENLKHHDSVAKAVLSGRFDAGSVKDIIALRYIAKGLKILYISDPIPSVPFVVRPDCDKKLITAVKEALLKINPKDPVQQQKMVKWNEEFRYGFVEAKDTDYDPVRRIFEKYH